MNDNTRRLLERRLQKRRKRRERRQAARPNRTEPTAPVAHSAPVADLAPPPGTPCADCRTGIASTSAEIGTPGGRPSVVFPICRPCASEAPAALRRLGFAGYRQMVERNMRDAANTGRAG